MNTFVGKVGKLWSQSSSLFHLVIRLPIWQADLMFIDPALAVAMVALHCL
jgi:hypothetical protein